MKDVAPVLIASCPKKGVCGYIASAGLERRTLGVIVIAFDTASIRNVAMKLR